MTSQIREFIDDLVLEVAKRAEPPAGDVKSMVVMLSARCLQALSVFRVIRPDVTDTELSEYAGLLEEGHSEAIEQFDESDATLFEIGCYHYFRLKMGIDHVPSAPVRSILSEIVSDFCALCRDVGGVENARDLFDERCLMYQRLFKGGMGTDDLIHGPLMQLILRSENDAAPESYVWEEGPLWITNIAITHAIHISVVEWHANLVACYDLIKNSWEIVEQQLEHRLKAAGWDSASIESFLLEKDMDRAREVMRGVKARRGQEQTDGDAQ